MLKLIRKILLALDHSSTKLNKKLYKLLIAYIRSYLPQSCIDQLQEWYNYFQFEKKANFRISNKKVWLTYSQCGRLTLTDFFLQLDKIKPIENAFACIELHEQENRRSKKKGVHIHCLVEFIHKVETINSRFFDLTSSEGAILHPHVSSIGNKKIDVENLTSYILKDPQCVQAFGSKYQYLLDDQILCPITNVPVYKANLNRICIKLAEQGFVRDAMLLFNSISPDAFLRRGKSYENALKHHFELINSQIYEPTYSMDNWDKKWLLFFIYWLKLPIGKKTLVISSDSSRGKTQLLRRVLHYLNIKYLHLDSKENLKLNNPRIEVLLWDDCQDLKKFSREMIISLLDSKRTTSLSIKYGSGMLLENQLVIILTNLDIKIRKDRLSLFDEITRQAAIQNRIIPLIIKPGLTCFKKEGLEMIFTNNPAIEILNQENLKGLFRDFCVEQDFENLNLTHCLDRNFKSLRELHVVEESRRNTANLDVKILEKTLKRGLEASMERQNEI